MHNQGDQSVNVALITTPPLPTPHPTRPNYPNPPAHSLTALVLTDHHPSHLLKQWVRITMHSLLWAPQHWVHSCPVADHSHLAAHTQRPSLWPITKAGPISQPQWQDAASLLLILTKEGRDVISSVEIWQLCGDRAHVCPPACFLMSAGWGSTLSSVSLCVCVWCVGTGQGQGNPGMLCHGLILQWHKTQQLL